jgi:hypothetical protein
VLKKTKGAGTATGAHAAAALRDYAKRAQAAVRLQRETGFKAAYLLTQNFAILVSGILIECPEGLGASPSAHTNGEDDPVPEDDGREACARQVGETHAGEDREAAREAREEDVPRASPARITRGNCSDALF